MKISELQKILKEALEEYGDLYIAIDSSYGEYKPCYRISVGTTTENEHNKLALGLGAYMIYEISDHVTRGEEASSFFGDEGFIEILSEGQ